VILIARQAYRKLIHTSGAKKSVLIYATVHKLQQSIYAGGN